ncbi:MAG: DUF4781 domain-containing protein [Myxococcaceae bacterium]|nr:DUF4781 domain-containing protein [Myxococcaceae bacterium]
MTVRNDFKSTSSLGGNTGVERPETPRAETAPNPSVAKTGEASTVAQWVKTTPVVRRETVSALETRATELWQTLAPDQVEVEGTSDRAQLVADWQDALCSLRGPGDAQALEASLQRNLGTLETLSGLLTADPQLATANSDVALLVPVALSLLTKQHPGAEVRLLAAKDGTLARRTGISSPHGSEIFVSIAYPGEPALHYAFNPKVLTGSTKGRELSAALTSSAELKARFHTAFTALKAQGQLEKFNGTADSLLRDASTSGAGGALLLRVFAALPWEDRQQVLSAFAAKHAQDVLDAPVGGLFKWVDGLRADEVLVDAEAEHVAAGLPAKEVSSLVNAQAVEGLNKQYAFELEHYAELTAPIFAAYQEAAKTPLALAGQKLRTFLRKAFGIEEDLAEKIAPLLDKGSAEPVHISPLPVIFDSPQTGTQAVTLLQVKRASGASSLVEYLAGEARVYTDINDWKANNRLPAGHVSYLKPSFKVRGDLPLQPREPTHASTDLKPKIDKAAMTAGVAVGGALMLGAGSVVPWWVTLPLFSGSAGWFTKRSAEALQDRATHGQTLSVLNPAARAEWFALAANTAMLGSMVATPVARVMATEALAGAKSAATVAAGVGVAGDVAWASALAGGTAQALNNWDQLSIGDKAMTLGSDAFWLAVTRNNAKAAGGVGKLFDVKAGRDKLIAGTPTADGVTRDMLTFLREYTPEMLGNISATKKPWEMMGKLDLKALSEGAAEIDPNKVGRAGKFHPVVASFGGLFATLFGRDSLRAAIDLLQGMNHVGRFSPALTKVLGNSIDGAVNVLAATLIEHAKIQGRVTNVRSDQEFGRVAHEYRAPGDPIIAHLPEGWKEEPGVSGVTKPLINWGTVDATPNFIRGMAALRNVVGDQAFAEYLKIETTGLDGRKVTIGESLVQAYGWLRGRIDDPKGGGYLWTLRMSTDGILSQGWRDSGDGVPRADGSLAELHLSTEVQGYAFNALQDFARLCREFGLNRDSALLKRTRDALKLPEAVFTPESAEARAQQFKANFHQDFWVTAERAQQYLEQNPDVFMKMQRRYKAVYKKTPTLENVAKTLEGYGGMAEMKNGHASVEPLVASNTGHLLGSRIMDDVDPRRTKAIVDRMLAPDMFAEEGVLTLSRMGTRYKPGAYHQGSTWPWDTGYIARAMRQRGFEEQGRDLENRVLKLVAREGSMVELAIGTMPGSFAKWDRTPSGAKKHPVATREKKVKDPEMGMNRVLQPPQKDQAWTITLVWRLLLERGWIQPPPPQGSGLKSWEIWADKTAQDLDKVLAQKLQLVPTVRANPTDDERRQGLLSTADEKH